MKLWIPLLPGELYLWIRLMKTFWVLKKKGAGLNKHGGQKWTALPLHKDGIHSVMLSVVIFTMGLILKSDWWPCPFAVWIISCLFVFSFCTFSQKATKECINTVLSFNVFRQCSVRPLAQEQDTRRVPHWATCHGIHYRRRVFQRNALRLWGHAGQWEVGSHHWWVVLQRVV